MTIDPRVRRIGFAVFEAAILHDWGVRNVRSDVPASRVRRLLIPILVTMLDRHEPTVLLVPDVRSGAVRRSPYARETVNGIVREALDRGIVVCALTDGQVKAAFQQATGHKRPNKPQINAVIADWFRDLRPFVPKARRLWEPEGYFEPLFQAVAQYCAWQGVPDVKRDSGDTDEVGRSRRKKA